MLKDPIVEEIRKTRDSHAARFGCDVEGIVRDLQRRDKASGRKLYNFKPRKSVKT